MPTGFKNLPGLDNRNRMNIQALENIAIDWESIPAEKAEGMTGFVHSKTLEFPGFKIRQLVFSENYEADQWCEKGHIIFVLSGELIIEQKDQATLKVRKDHSLVLGDGISSHKARTETQATVLIID